MYPKISVITAVYNNEKYIECALKSTLSQTYPNLEVIVVDGGSTDGTLKIIERYRKQIQHLISGPDQGIYDALNKGVSLATGDVIGFLHSDDQFASNNVLEQIAQIFKAGSIDCTYGDLEYIRNDQVVRYWKSSPFSKELLSLGWMPPHPTVYLTREIYQKVGRFNLDYQIAADYDFILRVFGLPELRTNYIPKVTVQMRTGGASNKNLKKILQKSAEDLQILRSHKYSGLKTLLFKNFFKVGQLFLRSKE